jgi:DNA-binding NtrC family response regulator
VVATCAQVAPTPATVLILGETGTGKELLAQAIHRRSARPGRFVALNCGAIPEALVESELFGHVKGAFTGAGADKAGLFQHAHGGTLFLDEVGSLPLSSQFSLLRVLQQGRVRPVGGGEEVAVDVRIVAATSEPLDAAVKEGRFRPDLFYRLDVIRVTVPPLRERREDIPVLFEAFCRELARQYDLPAPEVTPAFIEALRAHDWPGNARQLRNLSERLVLTRRGLRLDAPHLAELLALDSAPAAGEMPVTVEPGVTLEGFLAPRITALERRYLEEMLRLHGGRMQATATAAGMSRRTLLRKLHQLGIDRRRFRRAGQPRPGPAAAGGDG